MRLLLFFLSKITETGRFTNVPVSGFERGRGMENISNIKQSLKHLILSGRQKRIEELESIIENKKEYLALHKQENILYEQVKEALPPSMRPVLVRYSDTMNDIMILQEHFFYTQGVRDCTCLILMLSGD